MTDRAQILRDRAAVRATFGALFDDASALLFHADPIGINLGTNTDEYEPEVATILPRLGTCASAADVARVVHEEFLRWFDAADVGPRARYDELAAQLWKLWLHHRGGS